MTTYPAKVTEIPNPAMAPPPLRQRTLPTQPPSTEPEPADPDAGEPEPEREPPSSGIAPGSPW
ncbi:MAG: hypothetical protein JWO02_2329 [Solirubrobacterales bacterium]|nr:hypothetical protein [Solirubrobacterales bacterium]